MQLHPSATKRAASIFPSLEPMYKNIHNNKYDYSKAVYLNSKAKMIIICPEHGEFEQCHNKHGSAKQGCPVCGGRLVSNAKEFALRASKIHGNFYNYDKVAYINQYKPVIITCPIHGDFTQAPTNHLAGKGCNKCAIPARGLTRRKSFETFVKEANIKHLNKYLYNKESYTKTGDKTIIICKEHGPFEQNAASHLMGCGCPKCMVTGFNVAKPGKLYILSLNNETVFKVGITNRSVEARFSLEELSKIEVMHVEYFDNGKDCYDMEQYLLTSLKEYQYKGVNLLVSGNTELLTINPLPYLIETLQLKD